MKRSKTHESGSFCFDEDMIESEINTNEVSLYDKDSQDAEWDSPGRVQRLAAPFVHAGEIVLDLGIGTGQAVNGYTQKGAHVVGVDQASEALKGNDIFIFTIEIIPEDGTVTAIEEYPRAGVTVYGHTKRGIKSS